ncbi:sensor histidine kinase [Tenacibaculum aestuarii]|uniref:sensor histidine kinase n=1 Tax=Tenacibaculum aestuarii TaxID=362781 RepID=UPI0038965843
MFTSESEIMLTILVSTVLLLFFCGVVIYFLFKYQRKRYSHQQEVFELKESFNKILLNSKIQIQEQTLDHISKELHSNIGQLASLININLSELLHKTEEKEIVIETKALAKSLLSELKSISTALNTDYIMKVGFEKALKNELNRVSKTIKYPVNFNVKGNAFSLGPEKEIILFRLCQEVINNVIRYAQASEMNVNLDYDNDSIKLAIEDNGIGFDIDSVKKNREKNSSTGLLNIEKRAKVINANVNIVSKINYGTKVSLLISR